MTQSSPDTLLASGQRVRIADAEPGVPDQKSVVYYGHFRGLAGSVVKAYPDGTVAIEIDRDTLPEPVRLRHEASERAQQERWLSGLSDDDRNKLSDRERAFRLRYTVLVSANNVLPESAGSARQPKPAAQKAEPDAPARATTADLDSAEERYLRSKRKD